MTVRLVPTRDPGKIPEHTLWTLTKDTRTAEARMRMTPIGPELRFYVSSRETGTLDLLWAMIYKDGEGGSLGDDAELKRREFEVRGWTGVRDVSAADTAGPESCGWCLDGWICEQHPDQPWPHPDPAAEDAPALAPDTVHERPLSVPAAGLLRHRRDGAPAR